MPRPCSICSHPNQKAIDDALFGTGTDSGTALRDIAGQFGVARSTLQRHKQHARVTGQVVRKISGTFTSLPPRKQAYVRGRLDGKSKRQAALAAGFTEAMADHPAKIETKDVREAFTALIRATISPDKIAETLKAGMDAMETKFFAEKGLVQDQRDVIAWSERRQYMQLAAEYGGYHKPEKTDAPQGGGVILILPDGPNNPAPVIEGQLAESKADSSGPIIILPDEAHSG